MRKIEELVRGFSERPRAKNIERVCEVARVKAERERREDETKSTNVAGVG